MRRCSLAGLGFLAIAALGSTAHAQRFEFDYTGKLVTFTVPIDGTYQIIVFGAQGGTVSVQGVVSPGGRGAEIGGNFDLTQGEVLRIAVGGAGGWFNSGGGGSFVVGPGNTPLVVAGGGGGGGFTINPFAPPNQQVTGGLPGGDGVTSAGDGNGGSSPGLDILSGAGGGGFLSPGQNSLSGALGGAAWPFLAAGGGGFGGGGGAGSYPPYGGGGGGGGYSGGNGGFSHSIARFVGPGGGGGSFLGPAGTDQILVAGIRSGDGEVMISYVFAGTPGKPNCLGQSVSALARQGGGLNNAAAELGYPSVDALQDAILTYCGD